MSALQYIGAIVSWWDNFEIEGTFRENGPCWIAESGEVQFSQLDYSSYNRKHGPSSIISNGSITYTNMLGVLHRTNGPAKIAADGSKEYWVNGKMMPADTFFLKYGVV